MGNQVKVEIEIPGVKRRCDKFDPNRLPVSTEIFEHLRQELKLIHIDAERDGWIGPCLNKHGGSRPPIFILPAFNYFRGSYCQCEGTLDELYAIITGPDRPKPYGINRFSKIFGDLDIDHKNLVSAGDPVADRRSPEQGSA